MEIETITLRIYSLHIWTCLLLFFLDQKDFKELFKQPIPYFQWKQHLKKKNVVKLLKLATSSSYMSVQCKNCTPSQKGFLAVSKNRLKHLYGPEYY